MGEDTIESEPTARQEPAELTVKTEVAAVFVVVAMVVGVGLGLAIGASAFGSDSNGSDDRGSAETVGGVVNETAFDAAKDECASDSLYVRVLDDGAALEVKGEGEESLGADITEIYCVLESLGAPESVISRMSSTRDLDGTQDGSWSEIYATWKYHPNSGLNMIFEERR
ncbi:hypothetical protein G1H11_05620 [Phytoactinopolyspora alkaliphila]|uniref:Uncharacterized protein n=1 Tax=Phytoactinopolyspora alkaliphila TaxID=1783498 RepID=A0A6N9YIM1_9ACTN|nr:hypothetical protein [Phytoactinopolyspora alkaliphila]NED94785.1 hypothetical protein [Phytoactinopolyspora alkaliphila]